MSTRALSPCMGIQPHLEAFADGELRGDLLRRVSQHVEECSMCGRLVEGVRDLGGLLRSRPAQESDFADLAGLADGVVSRVRAEERESWRGKFQRATDDFHWVFVGAGSIAAAFFSVLLVSVVMQSSVEQRADSLAAMLNTMTVAPPNLGLATVVPSSLVGPGPDDVEFANLTEVNKAGHVMSLQPLSLENEMTPFETQQLVNQLRGLRFAQQTERSMTDPDARRFIWLFSATEVRAKKVL